MRNRRGSFLCPDFDQLLFCSGKLLHEVHEVSIFAVPLLFVFLQLPTGAEFFPDAEYAGEDAVWRDLENDTVIGADGIFDS